MRTSADLMTSPPSPPNRHRRRIEIRFCGAGSRGIRSDGDRVPDFVPSLNTLKSQGDVLVEALERHRLEFGTYPTTATDAGITLPRNYYGSWHYRVAVDRKSFELEIGEYTGLNPFTLYCPARRAHGPRPVATDDVFTNEQKLLHYRTGAGDESSSSRPLFSCSDWVGVLAANGSADRRPMEVQRRHRGTRVHHLPPRRSRDRGIRRRRSHSHGMAKRGI